MTLERVLRRDRAVATLALVVVAAAAWAVLLRMHPGMMPGMAMPPWT